MGFLSLSIHTPSFACPRPPGARARPSDSVQWKRHLRRLRHRPSVESSRRSSVIAVICLRDSEQCPRRILGRGSGEHICHAAAAGMNKTVDHLSSRPESERLYVALPLWRIKCMGGRRKAFSKFITIEGRKKHCAYTQSFLTDLGVNSLLRLAMTLHVGGLAPNPKCPSVRSPSCSKKVPSSKC